MRGEDPGPRVEPFRLLDGLRGGVEQLRLLAGPHLLAPHGRQRLESNQTVALSWEAAELPATMLATVLGESCSVFVLRLQEDPSISTR